MAQPSKVTTSQIKPFGSFVLVSFDESKEETTDGGLIIPETEASQFKVQDGEIHAVGAVVEEDDFVHKGDKVIIPTDLIGIDVTDRIETLIEGKVFRIVAVEKVIAIIS